MKTVDYKSLPFFFMPKYIQRVHGMAICVYLQWFLLISCKENVGWVAKRCGKAKA